MVFEKHEPDTPDDHTPASWADRVRRAMSGAWQDLAGALDLPPELPQLHLDLVKAGPRAISLRLDMPDAPLFIKLFDRPGTQSAFEAETRALLALHDSGLVPRLRAFDTKRRFLVTEWAGVALTSGIIDGISSVQFGRELGIWLAEYDMVAPTEPATGNWATYLACCGLDAGLIRMPEAAALLDEMQIFGLGLAQNDAAFHNFLIGEDHALRRCDFERASARPRGWDYVLTHNALFERDPSTAPEAVAAMAEAFADTHRGALLVEDLDQVARITFCARANAGMAEAA